MRSRPESGQNRNKAGSRLGLQVANWKILACICSSHTNMHTLMYKKWLTCEYRAHTCFTLIYHIPAMVLPCFLSAVNVLAAAHGCVLEIENKWAQLQGPWAPTYTQLLAYVWDRNTNKDQPVQWSHYTGEEPVQWAVKSVKRKEKGLEARDLSRCVLLIKLGVYWFDAVSLRTTKKMMEHIDFIIFRIKIKAILKPIRRFSPLSYAIPPNGRNQFGQLYPTVTKINK